MGLLVVGTVKAAFLEIMSSYSLLRPLSSNFSYKIKNMFPSGQ